MSEQKKNIQQVAIDAFTKAGIVVIFILLILFVMQLFYGQGEREVAERVVCASHLSLLGDNIRAFAADGEVYLDANKWCDILVSGSEISKKYFLCPNDKVGPGSYAMNPECGPNLPIDVVLLFETKPGWNQYGGPELLTDNHKGGSNILFNNGSVRFIAAKDFNSLKWK